MNNKEKQQCNNLLDWCKLIIKDSKQDNKIKSKISMKIKH